MGSTPAERAADIHAAFEDTTIKAVIISIGGDDQLTVLKHLDRELIKANPKPFFGYSDATNLLVFLWNLGIVGYHGGSIMAQYGRPKAMHPATEDSIRAALFTRGAYELTSQGRSGDVDRPWEDPRTFDDEPEMESVDGWSWHNATGVVEGVSWGGNLEILSELMMADREIRHPAAYDGCVLVLETSEEMPSPRAVYRVLRNMGERGLLERFPVLLMGRAKSWSFERPFGAGEKTRFRTGQREAVLRALGEYAPGTMAVLDVDFGHTDPQFVVPYGGVIRVDGPARSISVRY